MQKSWKWAYYLFEKGDSILRDAENFLDKELKEAQEGETFLNTRKAKTDELKSLLKSYKDQLDDNLRNVDTSQRWYFVETLGCFPFDQIDQSD